MVSNIVNNEDNWKLWPVDKPDNNTRFICLYNAAIDRMRNRND